MALTKEVTILIVIVGCVVSVIMGYSIHYLATNGFHGHGEPKDMSNEQRQYMREFRLKHLNWMARDHKESYRTGHGHVTGHSRRDTYGNGKRVDVETPVGAGVYEREQ